MTVEDAIERLAACTEKGLFTIDQPDSWAHGFVTNVAGYTGSGKPLSTEQSRIILRLVKRARAFLVIRDGVSGTEIDQLLATPCYRQTPYPSANIPREVRYLGDGLLGFRFKRNDSILRDITELRRGLDLGLTPHWFHRTYRIWVVAVTRETLEGVMQVIAQHRFSFDDGVVQFLTEASNSLGVAPAFDADPESGFIAGRVYDNEVVAWWIKDVLGGQPV